MDTSRTSWNSGFMEYLFHFPLSFIYQRYQSRGTIVQVRIYSTSICSIQPNDPPHCIGYESGDIPDGFDIPCGRGDGGGDPILVLVPALVGLLSMLVVTPTAIVCTILLMYKAVSKIEKKMLNYGANLLQLKILHRNNLDNPESKSDTCSVNDQGIINRIKIVCSWMIPGLCRDQPPSRANRVQSHKRAVVYMALGCDLVWALV